MSWQPLEQGLIGKRTVGMQRRLAVVPGQAEQHLVNGLIMDIFNIFIAQKLQFEKKDMAPMGLEIKFKRKDLLFVYSIHGGQLTLLALAERKKDEMLSIGLVLTPGQVATSETGTNIMSILDGIPSPYSRKD